MIDVKLVFRYQFDVNRRGLTLCSGSWNRFTLDEFRNIIQCEVRSITQEILQKIRGNLIEHLNLYHRSGYYLDGIVFKTR